MVMDASPAALTAFGRRFGIPTTEQLDELLASPQVQAVFVSVPHHLHLPIALKCAAAGKHIIMEKPLGVSAREIDEMISACREAGVLLTTNFSRRYRSSVQYARSLIERGAIGRLLGTCIVYGDEFPRKFWIDSRNDQPNWRARMATSGGGILMTHMVHYLDYFSYLTGEKVERVWCDSAALSVPELVEVEDTACVQYRYAGGGFGTLMSSFSCPGQQEYEVIWGTDGQIRLERESGQFYSKHQIDKLAPGSWHEFPLSAQVDSRAVLIEKFARAVFSKTQPDIPPESSRDVTLLAETAYRSRDLGSTYQSISTN
jgi:predicted dehydrogenase